MRRRRWAKGLRNERTGGAWTMRECRGRCRGRWERGGGGDRGGDGGWLRESVHMTRRPQLL